MQGSHDTVEHQERVLNLTDRLRDDGIDAEVDQYNAAPPEGWPLWCEKQVAAADIVLMVCTETYHRRVSGDEERDKGLGVVWEARIIRQLLYDAGAVSNKFVPVLFSDTSPEQIPTPLRGGIRYVVDTEDGYEELYRRLTGQPHPPLPALGAIRPLPARQRKWSEAEWTEIANKASEAERRASMSERERVSSKLVHFDSVRDAAISRIEKGKIIEQHINEIAHQPVRSVILIQEAKVTRNYIKKLYYWLKNPSEAKGSSISSETLPNGQKSSTSTSPEVLGGAGEGGNRRETKTRVSVSYPRLLSKGRSSTFLFHVYPRAITEQAQTQIQTLIAACDLEGKSVDSEGRVGNRITVGLHCPMIKFSPEQVTLRIEDRLNKASFVGIPVESCAPGEHDALATIVDAQTQDAYESVEFTIKVVDYAFDHVSTPLMSKASSAFFGIVSTGSFVLTSLKEIDVAFGITAGTAAATLTAVILGWGYLPFHVPKTVERGISV